MSQPDNLTRFNAHSDQAVGDPIRAAIEFRVGQTLTLNDQCDRIGVTSCVSFEPRMEIHGTGHQ